MQTTKGCDEINQMNIENINVLPLSITRRQSCLPSSIEISILTKHLNFKLFSRKTKMLKNIHCSESNSERRRLLQYKLS